MNKAKNREEVIFIDTETITEDELLKGDTYDGEDK